MVSLPRKFFCRCLSDARVGSSDQHYLLGSRMDSDARAPADVLTPELRAALTERNTIVVDESDIARLNLERSRVRAPFDGAIAQRIATVGDYVAIGTPILRLVKTDPLRLRLDVPERESSAVRVGQSVRVSVEGDTNVYTGKIARIAPALRRFSSPPSAAPHRSRARDCARRPHACNRE